MTIDFNYGKRTGVTSFKAIVQEFCENLRKYQVFIVAWVNLSSLSPADKTSLINLIDAVNAACAAAKALPDD